MLRKMLLINLAVLFFTIIVGPVLMGFFYKYISDGYGYAILPACLVEKNHA